METNYYVDEYGVLKVYHKNYILFEISGCENMNDDEIKNLIQNQLEDVVDFDKERELERLYE